MHPTPAELLIQSAVTALRRNRRAAIVCGLALLVALVLGSLAPMPTSKASTAARFEPPPVPGDATLVFLAIAVFLQALVLDELWAVRGLRRKRGFPISPIGLVELGLVFGFHFCAQFAWIACLVLAGASQTEMGTLATVVIPSGLSFAYALWVLRSQGLPLQVVGLERRDAGSAVAWGMRGYLAIYPLGFWAVVVATFVVGQAFGIQLENHPIAEAIDPRSVSDLGLVFLVAVVAAPLIEELIYRGFLYPVLRRLFGPGMGLLASSLLFALMHPGFYHWGPIFLVGLLFALLYERTGSLWAPITAHALHNFLQVAFALTFA